MDGGSGLNIVYMSTFDSMGIQRSQLRPSSTLFHEVVLVMGAIPLGQIHLLVTFGDQGNFCKEMLTFKVVIFPRTYHAILRRLAYTKFMAFPNYTYLKTMMPGPKGVITINTKYQHTFECDAECFQFAEALIRFERMATGTSAVNTNNDIKMVETT
jgi:hypothetical protein